jgi:predicted amidophosphoribosyltransferase
VAGSSRPTNTIVPQAGEQCRYCNGALPAGRRITFCPHCGQNLTVVNCLACGTELELGWKFCTTCGRPAST